MMEFIVDRVSEDSFYENLLIGLPKVLEKLPNVSKPTLTRFPPVNHNIICAWEQKHGVLLPEDLRCFYTSTNGLLYTYKFYYTEEETEENTIYGKIEVNSINNLVLVYGYEIRAEAGINTNLPRYEVKLGPESKVFELVNLDNIGRVVLLYTHPRYTPSVWVHNLDMKFYYLADDFTTYLRMCIYHLGIPLWQFAFTDDGIPEWTEMMFRLLSPNSLPLNRRIEDLKRSSIKEDIGDIPLNKINPNIFKSNRQSQSTHSLTHDKSSPKHAKRQPPAQNVTKSSPAKKLLQKKPLSHRSKF